MSDLFDVRYWDVFPKTIRVSRSPVERTIPLSIRGNPDGIPEFESVDPSIVNVDANGVVRFGLQSGSTLILVYDSPERARVRYVEVEVVHETPGAFWAAWEEPTP
ncbi:MAG TPA: hypothetical protein PKH31_15845 [Candidatus Sumerlaeota bacterium]|nr:hypothetical protein [Candidatus Sumerlaeota bacterium]